MFPFRAITGVFHRQNFSVQPDRDLSLCITRFKILVNKKVYHVPNGILTGYK